MLSLALSVIGIGKRIMGWLSEAVRWLFKAWYRIAIAALLMVGVFLFLSNVSLRRQVTHWKERYTVEATAHIKTKVGYTKAQKVAAEMNKNQVERIESEYAAIAIKSESDYEKRLADNRAALREWMRSKTAQSSAKGAGTGSAATVSGEVMSDATEALVPVTDLEIAADNYSQLTALIEWAKSIGKVETNKP